MSSDIFASLAVDDDIAVDPTICNSTLTCLYRARSLRGSLVSSARDHRTDP